ncbi:MAG: SpvB/TcaC N-terminal domain-containing protein [Myxococcota bacterium]
MNHRLGWAVALCLVVGPTVAMAQGKSAVTPSLATIPTGGAEGSASGLEGSFLPAPATGAGTYQVTLSLPPGRADFVPPLGLVYSTRGGDGELGIGWSLSGVPRIHRDTTRAPRYLDEPLWTPREDRWLLDGVPLVPVDAAAAELVDCAGLQKSDCATRPPEVAGWQEYRPSDGAPMRVFRSADARRWLAVASDGSWQEFGVLRRGPRLAVRFSARSLQTNAAGQVFSAKLTRRSDRYGSAAYYRYLAIGGYSLLQYVDYVSPNDCGGSLSVVGAHEARQCSVPLDRYAVRVALHYEERPDQARIYRGGAERTLARRLVRLDLTSDQDGSGRMLVRRYRLTYGPDHRSMLASVQLEGRKTDDDATYGFDVGVAIPEASLTDAVAGPLFPPLTFSYTGGPSSADPEAWMGGADLSLRSLDVPPPATVSVADGDTDLFDVNADGLVDVIRSSAGTVDAYFNAYSGSQGAPAGVLRRFSQAISMPVLGAPTMLSLSDDRWHPGDTDADARSELVYVPGVGDPQGRARPRRTVPGANVTLADQGLRWEFDATATVTPAALGMATAPEAYRYVDVDADGLVDILHITASDTYVWWNLGRYPNGEGLFGRAVPGAVDPWTLQELPSERCAPVFFGAVLLSDPNARLADVNGDGIVDLTYFVDPGVAVYYGRGERWGR